MKCLTFRTRSEEETIALGSVLASQLPERAVVLLIGNLGAGKTTLAKGLAGGRGVSPDEVSSPTFPLIHEYAAGKNEASVYHIDLYRLDEPAHVANLGLEEIFDRQALVLVEWGERFPALMPPDRFEIRLTAEGDDMRRIDVTRVRG